MFVCGRGVEHDLEFVQLMSHGREFAVHERSPEFEASGCVGRLHV